MNDVDETFANARDLGHTRLNYSRITAVGELSKRDSVDIYKTKVVSPRGKLALSVRNTKGEQDKVLDLSKYEDYLNELKQQFSPEEYAKEQAEKLADSKDMKPLELTAPGVRIEVYGTDRYGRQVLIADSAADEDSKEYQNMMALLEGSYEASKGDYYIRVSRDESIDADEEMPYAVQITMGKGYKHDYVAIESKSDDTKNDKTSRVPLTNANGALSAVNALQIQAMRYQATAQMLQVGYLNMANILNRNSKF